MTRLDGIESKKAGTRGNQLWIDETPSRPNKQFNNRVLFSPLVSMFSQYSTCACTRVARGQPACSPLTARCMSVDCTRAVRMQHAGSFTTCNASSRMPACISNELLHKRKYYDGLSTWWYKYVSISLLVSETIGIYAEKNVFISADHQLDIKVRTIWTSLRAPI